MWCRIALITLGYQLLLENDDCLYVIKCHKNKLTLDEERWCWALKIEEGGQSIYENEMREDER